MPFDGFVWPKQNWFRMPNDWTDATAGMSYMAEMKVVEYVMRHTWGFSGQDKPKRITLDEFQNGRKRTNGSRMDMGIGMRKPSVIDGIKRAIADGFLIVETDRSDEARIKKRYSLRMKEGYGNRTAAVRKSNTGGKENIPRSEKDTIERNTMSPPTADDSKSKDPPGRKKKRQPSAFDHRCAEELRKVVSSVVKVNCKADVRKWAEQFRLMREHDEVPKEEIRRTIQWYGDHVDDEYAIEAYSAKTFREKYKAGKFAGAMRRAGRGPDAGTGGIRDGQDPKLRRVRSLYFGRHGVDGGQVMQPLVDAILVEMGEEPGSVRDIDL